MRQEEDVIDNSQPANPSRDELFRLLTEEVRDITETERLKGWTPWVILASLASGAWILAHDLLTSQYSKRACVAAFLLVTLTLHIARIVQTNLDTLSEERDSKASFFFLHSTTSAFTLFVTSGWMAGIAYAVVRLAPLATNRRIFLGGAVLYSILALFVLLMLVLVVARLPLPMPRHPPPPIRSAAISGAVMIGLIALGDGIVRSGFLHNLTLVELRIGTIIALEALGIVFLSRNTGHQSDSRKALSEIRRDLVLGDISSAEAAHRSRTILHGMWLSDVVMKDMNALLKLISSARTEYEEALGKVATFKTNVDTSSGEKRTETARLALGNMLDSLGAHEARICEIILEYHRQLFSLRFRIQLVTRLTSRAEADGKRLMAGIENAESPVNRLQLQFRAEYMELQKAWNLRFPGEPRNHEPFARLAKRPDARLKI